VSARDELIEIVTRDSESSGGDETWATDLVEAVEREAREGLQAQNQVHTSGEAVGYANQVLKGLLRNLTEVRAQRGAERISLPEGRDQQLKRMGEVEGLSIAIAAVKRRIR